MTVKCWIYSILLLCSHVNIEDDCGNPFTINRGNCYRCRVDSFRDMKMFIYCVTAIAKLATNAAPDVFIKSVVLMYVTVTVYFTSATAS